MVHKTEGAGLNIYMGGISPGGFLGIPNTDEEETGMFGKSRTAASNLEMKKEEIRKKALKVLADQHEQDSEDFYDKSDGSRDTIEESKQTLDMVREEKQNLNAKESQEAMRKDLGIEEDSQEHKDLQLMRKIAANVLGDYDSTVTTRLETGLEDIARWDGKGTPEISRLYDRLTKEEWDRALELGDQPLTYYQSKCISDDEVEEMLEKQFAKPARSAMEEANDTIAAVRDGLLRQHGMTDALVEKEVIEQAGSDEIKGMLTEDAMEHVKEELEEEVEEAKEAAEEKEEEEIKAEEAEENAAEAARAGQPVDHHDPDRISTSETQMHDAVFQMPDRRNEMEQAQAKINRMLEEEKLLEEDLKGILVDQTI